MKSLLALLILFICLQGVHSFAQIISGSVTQRETNEPIIGVQITNIHNGHSTITNSKGEFDIEAKGDELIEFERDGYKTVRVRIPIAIPRYFAISMQQRLQRPNALLATGDYLTDSAANGRLYSFYLSKPRLTGLDVIEHPFSAISKYNRRIWAFQDNYKWMEQMKYVDYTFSDKVLQQIAGLPADSAALYRKRYAIPYEHLRSMKAYDVYTYIRQTVDIFRRGRDPRFSPSRSSQ